MSSLSRLVGLICIVILLVFCKKGKNSYSNTPYLNISELSQIKTDLGKDSLIILNLAYKDGDGDIGLEDKDSFPPFNYGGKYFYNLIIDYFVMKNGVWIKPPNPLSAADTIFFSERIPNITPTGKQKWIEGNLRVRIPANPFDLKPDTIRFGLQLIDRSLKKSDQIFSKSITLIH